jgi:hypothetical protein
VGAAIAAGSQLENGICALLVVAASRIVIPNRLKCGDSQTRRMFHWEWLRNQPILRRIRTSPIRLVRAVIMPAASDLGFW